MNRQPSRVLVDTDRRDLVRGAAAAGMLGAPALVRAQSAPIKVGVILPLSGVLAFVGTATRRGTELAVKMFNEQGTRIEASFVDTESKPENGRVAAEKLIRDGCSILVGAWDSGATISAAQAAEAAKVPLVVNIASAPQITEQGFTMVFRNFVTAPQLVRNAVARIKELRGPQFDPKTAVVMHVNDTFGQSMQGGVAALWEKLDVGIKIVDTISYDLRARDLSVEVAKARASKADLLLPITRVNDAILIVREMVKQDWVPTAIIGPGSPGPYERAFTDALGKYADDYISCVPWWDPRQELARRVIDRWSREFPKERFELNSGFGWESIQVVADAFARARSSRPADLHAALKVTDIREHVMFGGPIRFDEKGQNNNIGGVMLQNQGGEPKVVLPGDAAQAKAKLPLTPWSNRA
jgi:branched-chain amino acid transport system substrate-binding protein